MTPRELSTLHEFHTTTSDDGSRVTPGCACGWQGGAYVDEVDAYADARREYDEHLRQLDELSGSEEVPDLPA